MKYKRLRVPDTHESDDERAISKFGDRTQDDLPCLVWAHDSDIQASVAVVPVPWQETEVTPFHRQSRPPYAAGDRITLEFDGIKSSGEIDVVMPDGSAIWVWFDGGAGRRMLCLRDEISIKLEVRDIDSA